MGPSPTARPRILPALPPTLLSPRAGGEEPTARATQHPAHLRPSLTWGSQLPLALSPCSCSHDHTKTTGRSRPATLTWASSQQTCRNKRKAELGGTPGRLPQQSAQQSSPGLARPPGPEPSASLGLAFCSLRQGVGPNSPRALAECPPHDRGQNTVSQPLECFPGTDGARKLSLTLLSVRACPVAWETLGVLGQFL